MRTVTDTFGRPIADRLAALAIDVACAAPIRIETATTKVAARWLEELRAVLDDARIDWRALVAARFEQQDGRWVTKAPRGQKLWLFLGYASS
jgi:hypothetical protein